MTDDKLQNEPEKVQELPFTPSSSEGWARALQWSHYNTHARRYAEGYIARLIEHISDANRDELTRYLTAKAAQGVKISSIQGIAGVLYRLDKLTAGAPWSELAPEELTESLLKFANTHSPSTTDHYASTVKAFWAWRSGGLCPQEVRIALRRRAIGRENHRAPISQEVFNSLLRQAAESTDASRGAFYLAFLWSLWDTGFRISELLGLRVDSLTFRDGGVEIRIPAGAPDLKTGPRTIYCVECAPALQHWVTHMHPSNHPEAPLWPAYRTMTPLLRTSVDNMLARLAIRAGVKPPHPHLFRHTRATRAARAGWNVHQMNRYFGWSGKSNMAANYVHLVLSDVEDRVKQDALASPNPQRSVPSHAAAVSVVPKPPPPPAAAPVEPPSFDAAGVAAAIAAALAAVDQQKRKK